VTRMAPGGGELMEYCHVHGAWGGEWMECSFVVLTYFISSREGNQHDENNYNVYNSDGLSHIE
jgi:hypothetical protein